MNAAQQAAAVDRLRRYCALMPLDKYPFSEKYGWIQNKYEVSWQIVPTALGKLLQDKDLQKSQRVMQALLQMKKIDIGGLKKAHANK